MNLNIEKKMSESDNINEFSNNNRIEEGNLLHTWILDVVRGSRKDFTVFHSIRNPGPALIMYIWLRVCM